jgi:hypothetical protein
VTAAENLGAWLWATEILRCDICKAANLNGMATPGNDLLDLHVTLYGCQIVHLMTQDFLFNMTTGKYHIRDFDQTRTTLFTTKPGTRMITRLSNPRARLAARKSVVHN